MKLKNLLSVPTYVQMIKMVHFRRADFLLSPFTKAGDMSQIRGDFNIVPVPGLKVVLPGSRHVAISKQYKNGKRIFEAVQVGLRIMHDRGLVRESYITAGFFNPLVEDWTVLCCSDER